MCFTKRLETLYTCSDECCVPFQFPSQSLFHVTTLMKSRFIELNIDLNFQVMALSLVDR